MSDKPSQNNDQVSGSKNSTTKDSSHEESDLSPSDKKKKNHTPVGYR